MDALTAIYARRTINYFDPQFELNREQLQTLVEAAMQAPSAFNIQHSRFLIVHGKDAQSQLKDLCYGQPKVAEASAAILVLADNRGHEKIARINQNAQEQGLFDEATAQAINTMVHQAYDGQPEVAQTEALRSACLAASQLMIAATAMGLDTCPMIGLDAAAIQQTLGLADQYQIAMLIMVGKALDNNWSKKPRLAVDEVTSHLTDLKAPHAFAEV